MKVLYLTNLMAPYRVDFFNELSKYCKLTVLFERKAANDRDDSWYNNYFEFDARFLKSQNIGNESSISFEIIKYLKEDFDYIVLGGYSTLTSMIACIYLKMHDIPYILNADGGFISENENRLKYYIKRFFISSASYWLSSSNETSEYLKYYGAKESKIFLFPFSSISNKDLIIKPVDNQQKELLKEEKNILYNKVIVTVGQFIPRKGFDWMIEALSTVDRHIGIYIIGGKPTAEYLNMKEKYKMTNLHFVDFQNKTELFKWYRLADLCIFPTREDIWGLIINEALSQGLPVITTNKCNAGLALIHNDINGYIIPVEDQELLIKYTNNILFNLSLKNDEKEKKAFNIIHNYTIENMAKTHFDILLEIQSLNKVH